MSYEIWLIRLLAINTCSFLVFGILLLILLLVSKRNSYYRRVGIAVPRDKSTLEKLVLTLLKIVGLLFLIGLLVLLAYFTISFISRSELINLGNLNINSFSKNLSAPRNSTTFGIYTPLEQLNLT